MAKLISKTYGEALFELAVEESKMDLFVEEITMILDLFSENKEFQELMNHPKIVKEEKIEVLEAVFKGRIQDELLGFFTIIIKKDRYNQVEEILKYFLQEVKAYKGIGTVTVVTATPMRIGQRSQIEKRLLETTKYEQLEINYQVDENLIGGMKIRIGDRVVDSSIQTKLNELTKQLMKIQLA